MKKSLIIFCFILLGSAAQSQVLISILLGDKLNSPDLEFGLEGGFNYTSIAGFETSDYLRNFNLGFYFDIRMKNQLFLYTGVQVKSGFGIDNLTENDRTELESKVAPVEGDYSQKVSAFMVPILAKYNFKNHFYVEAGPQLGLIYKGWIEFNSDKNGVETLSKQYNDDLLNKINAGVAIGTGYKLMQGEGWTIGIRYYQGLTNVFKGHSGTTHNSINLKVNIPIGAGSKKEDM